MKYLLLLLLLSSCVTKKEINAAIWVNNFMGEKDSESIKDLCERYPEIRDYGFYRVLNTGKKEFISICNPSARGFVAMYKTDFQKILDQNLPAGK